MIKSLLLLCLLPLLLLAQLSIKPFNNKSLEKESLEIIPLRLQAKAKITSPKVTPFANLTGLSGVMDTLDYNVDPSANFGFWGQDIMAMWFEAPADLQIELWVLQSVTTRAEKEVLK